MDEDLYDEFGNYIGPDINEQMEEGEDVMDQEWLNEMNQLQLGEKEDYEGAQESRAPDGQQDSLMAYQGKEIFYN